MRLFLLPSKNILRGLFLSSDVPVPGICSEAWRQHLKGTGFLGISRPVESECLGLGPSSCVPEQAESQTPWVILMKSQVWEIAAKVTLVGLWWSRFLRPGSALLLPVFS